MSETLAASEKLLLVTVAPGEIVRVSPHPSGFRGLPPLELQGGDTLRVPESEAERLYQARKVVGLVSGKVKPPAPTPEPRPMVRYADGTVSDPGEPYRVVAATRQGADDEAFYREEIKRLEDERRAEREARRGRGPEQLSFGSHYGVTNPLGPIAGVDD